MGCFQTEVIGKLLAILFELTNSYKVYFIFAISEELSSAFLNSNSIMLL